MGTFLREPDPESTGITPAVARPYNTVRPLTAAAARIKINDRFETDRLAKRKKATVWQSEAYNYFDMVGEIKYAFLLTGAIMSRMKLFLGYVDTPSDQPGRLEDTDALPDDYLKAAQAHFQRLESGFGGIPGMLRNASINLSIAGECFLLQEKEKPASGIPEKWTIRSVDEIEVDNNGMVMLRTSSALKGQDGLEPMAKDAFIGRIWRPHPRWCADPATEVFTEDGWRRYDQLHVGDRVLTLNHATGLSEWNDVEKVAVFDVVDEDMVRIVGQRHSSLTTPDHKWPVIGRVREQGVPGVGRERIWRTSEHLNSNHSLITAAPCADLPTEPKYRDEFVELVAWYWTEGTLDGWGRNVRRASDSLVKVNRELLDPEAWKSWFTEKRCSAGLSLMDVGVGMGRGEGRAAQQAAADIRRHGVPKVEDAARLSTVLGVPEEEVRAFYRWGDVQGQALICQSHRVNEANVARIRRALTALHGPARPVARGAVGPAWVERVDQGKGMTVFALNSDASAPLLEVVEGRKKIVRNDFILALTQAQLDIFIETSIAADGHRNVITQAMDERLDAFELAAVLAGRDTWRFERARSTLDPKSKCYGIGMAARGSIREGTFAIGSSRSSNVSREKYTGVVWCPTTRNKTWLARRDGSVYFTGNTDDPDSSMRSLLDLCSELLLLNRTVRATAKSRLNAGALFIPDGLSVAAQPDVTDEDGDFETAEDDAFEQELIAAMTLPIQDEDSASAVVPLLIRGPGELGNQIKQFRFERSFDAALAERADRVLDRILQGIDMPKDIVTGLSAVKYSNAIVVQDSLYRTHIEPLAILLCDSLTMIFLRPAMRAMGFPEEVVENTVIWYDPTDILTSADRATNADAGFDKFLLSGSVWRATHGFAETDAPTGEELLSRIIVGRGQITAELTEAVLAKIAPETFKEAREAALAGKAAAFPENLQTLLDTGQLPSEEGQEPLPPEILEGLPVPSPAPPGDDTGGVLTEEESAAQMEQMAMEEAAAQGEAGPGGPPEGMPGGPPGGMPGLPPM